MNSRAMGLHASVNTKVKRAALRGNLFSHVMPDDLLKFGLRNPCRIISEPDRAATPQEWLAFP